MTRKNAWAKESGPVSLCLVIAYTGPINYLIQIDPIELLPTCLKEWFFLAPETT